MWYRRTTFGKNIGQSTKVVTMSKESRKALAKALGLEVVDDNADLVIPSGFLIGEKGFSDFIEYWLDSILRVDFQDESKRIERYRSYDLMESYSGEVSLMLDTYADESVGIGFNRDIIDIYTNKKEVTSYVLEVLEKNDFYRNLRSYIRTMCKYGDVLLYVVSPIEFLMDRLSPSIPNTSLSAFYSKIKENSKKRNKSDKVIPYIVSIKPEYWRISSSFLGKALSYEINNVDGRPVSIVETPLRTVQMTLPDDRTNPYGMSLIEPMRAVCDQLATLEALMALSRASRIERLVVKIPTTSSNPVSAFSELMKARAYWKNVLFSDSTGSAKPYNKTLSLTDMMFIPSLDGFSVDAIRPSIDISSTEDVEYFVDKLLSLTGLPKGYFMADSTTSRGSALQAQDLKFMRRLLPIQNAVINSIVKLVYVIAAYGEFDVSDLEVEVSLSVPMEISDELINRYTSIFSSAKSIISDYLGDDSEISKKTLNEVLKYLGAPEDLIDILSKAADSSVPAADSSEGETGDRDFGGIDFGSSSEEEEKEIYSPEVSKGEEAEEPQSGKEEAPSTTPETAKGGEEKPAAKGAKPGIQKASITSSSKNLLEIQIIRDLSNALSENLRN